MRKSVILILSGAFAAAGFILYIIFSSPQSGNNSYAHEYYYNNENSREGLNPMKYRINNFRRGFVSTTDMLDLNPDSITVLVNKEFGLPADYIPQDLVVPNILFNFSYYDEKKLLRKEAADALEELFKAADAQGLHLYGISGYRSYSRQEEIYNNNIETQGFAHTNKYSARPGHSEHQTGLVMDVSTPSIDNRLEEVFEGTPEGRWLAQNAYKYGFIIRYPKEKTDITMYSYEPWHLRYVGKDLAKYLYENNLTLEEYYNYTPSQEFLDREAYFNKLAEQDEQERAQRKASENNRNENQPNNNTYSGSWSNEKKSEDSFDKPKNDSSSDLPESNSENTNDNTSKEETNKKPDAGTSGNTETEQNRPEHNTGGNSNGNYPDDNISDGSDTDEDSGDYNEEDIIEDGDQNQDVIPEDPEDFDDTEYEDGQTGNTASSVNNEYNPDEEMWEDEEEPLYEDGSSFEDTVNNTYSIGYEYYYYYPDTQGESYE